MQYDKPEYEQVAQVLHGTLNNVFTGDRFNYYPHKVTIVLDQWEELIDVVAVFYRRWGDEIGDTLLYDSNGYYRPRVNNNAMTVDLYYNDFIEPIVVDDEE